MNRLQRIFLTLALCLGLGQSAAAAGSPVSLFNFQVSGIGVWTPTASSLFVHGAWSPYFGLGVLGIRGEIGVTGLDFGGGRILISNYEALLHIALFPTLAIEGGGGMHLWHNQGVPAMAFSGNLIFSGVAYVDRLFAGYTRYTGAGGANILRAGVGFEL